MPSLRPRRARGRASAKRPCATAAPTTTIVRSTWFSQNFSEDYWLDYVLSGELAVPAGDTPEPFVDADDIADVAVAALTDDRHIGQLYELTGPRLLTFGDAAVEISRAAGRESATCRYRSRSTQRSPRSRARPPRRSRWSAACSTRSWTAGTPTWPTECAAPWAASPGTSATMRGPPHGDRRLERVGGGRDELTTAPGHDRLNRRSWPGADYFAATGVLLAAAASSNAMAGQFASESFGLAGTPGSGNLLGHANAFPRDGLASQCNDGIGIGARRS